jgi:PIN domain nuclease of toxin-antitoxin system
MDLLLDTHAIIWFFNGDESLSKKALSHILAAENRKFVSIISIWEVSIKIGLGKLSFEGSTKAFYELLNNNGFEVLPLSIEHLFQYETLEFFHRDPFDRILITQANVEKMAIITKDENIKKYQIQSIW